MNAPWPRPIVKGRNVGTGAPVSEERRRVHRGELFRNGSGNELIDTDPVLLGQPFDLRLDRARQSQRVFAELFHVLILRIAWPGVNKVMPNRGRIRARHGR